MGAQPLWTRDDSPSAGRNRPIGERIAALLGTLRRPAQPSPSDTAYRCPLCGREFTRAEATLCPTCPVAERCGLVMCPSCGYEFPPV